MRIYQSEANQRPTTKFKLTAKAGTFKLCPELNEAHPASSGKILNDPEQSIRINRMDQSTVLKQIKLIL